MVHGGEDEQPSVGERLVGALRSIRGRAAGNAPRTMTRCAVCNRAGATFRVAHGALLCDSCDDGATHGHL